ncbi:AmmeMemoRadiSam system protein B [Candidatus Parcubacteria bacterium]|nr:AmmeMemoRadiSam system protein B [Candidatus Parcubacteria bacterium]
MLNYENSEKVRPPALAGFFYPEEKQELEKMIDNFLKKTSVSETKARILGLVLPHADYAYSGSVACFGFKKLSKEKIDTVIIIGDSHYEYFDSVSIYDRGEWLTPLGKVKINKDLAQKINSESDRFFFKSSAHLQEHSIEVQLPFLQRVLKDFKIIPIIIGSENKDWEELGKAILKHCQAKRILIIASSDLSHYPYKKDAEKADKKTIEGILSCDPQKLSQVLRKLEKENISNIETFLCAEDSVKTLLYVMKNLGAQARVLKYAHSGDTAGEKQKVVGYAAIEFFQKIC